LHSGGAAGVGVALEALKFGAHIRSVLIAQIAVFFDGAIDEVFEAGRNFVIQPHRGNRRFVQDGIEYRRRSIALERQPPCGHFI
jgi:hypothetical protein